MTQANKDDTYNGFSSYETWNVALWLTNDETLYNMAKRYDSYHDAIRMLKYLGYSKTPDGISYTDNNLDINELDEVLSDSY